MNRLIRGALALFAVAFFAALSPLSFGLGTPLKTLLLDDEDPGVTVSGTGWSQIFWTNGTINSNLLGPPNGEGARKATTVSTETGYVQWDFVTKFSSTASTGGNYNLSAYIPNDDSGTASSVTYRIYTAPFDFSSGCGAYGLETTVSGFNQEANEGRWGSVLTFPLTDGQKCVRVQLSNASPNTGAFVWADALNLTRLFESSATIVDMPRAASAFAPATTTISSASSASPTIVASLTVTCPKAGNVMVSGSGESAAVSNIAGSNFNGVAYSISKDSTATDNANVVQSSALSTFNGDANRDFLNVSRFDTCSAGQAVTYRLTAYRAQAATGTGSFIWNGRLVAQYFPQGF